MSPRIGIGTDVHRFDFARDLVLGGIVFEGAEHGLAGHSDGDALVHAIVDAILGAGGLGDIGSVFGTSDPKWANASSMEFLKQTMILLHEAGFKVLNVSAQVIGNEPKISLRRAEMQTVLSTAIGAPVSISGTTTDGLGLTGRGEGLAAIATALIA